MRASVLSFLGGISVLAATWLLVGDATVGSEAVASKRGKASARVQRARAEVGQSPRSHYGSYGSPCQSVSTTAIGPSDAPAKKGRFRIFASSSNSSGDNSDLSVEFFLVDLKKGAVVNMTKDTSRCSGGSNQGQSCMSSSECPDGFCRSPFSGYGYGGSSASAGMDAKGKKAFFVFPGNPTGGNDDLGDEVFQYDVKRDELTQVTTMPGWCSNATDTACTTATDCPTDPPFASCRTADVSNFQVAPNGDLSFTTNGNPEGLNASHSNVLLYYKSGKKGGLSDIPFGGSFCSPLSQNPGQACASEEECGAVCGDNLVEAPETCEPFGGGAPCPTGQACQDPGSPQQCTCQPISG